MAMFERAWLPAPAIHETCISKLAGGQRFGPRGAVPNGFPKTINADMVWSGATLQYKPEAWRIHLADDHIQELEEAAAEFEARGLPIEQISPESFRLPTLGPTLARLVREVAYGRGFFALRGLDPDRYSKLRNIVLYVGLASYIGNRRGRQDEYGNMLLHLADLGSAAAPDNERQAPYSSVGQPFHTDTGSILGLYALSKASHGGESKIASSWHIYNELSRVRPDLICSLADSDWAFDTFGQSPPYKLRPLIHMKDGKVIFAFSRRPLLGSATSPRSQVVPDLSDDKLEALNMVQALAEQHSLQLDLEAGDMLFWNNLSLLHARNGFTDSANHRRHLVRIWLHNDHLGWAIPQAISETWSEAFQQNDRVQLWPLEPILDRSYISTQQRSSGHG